MGFPTTTFAQLIATMGFNAGQLALDATLGTLNVTPFNLASWSDFLTQAAEHVWRPDKERPEISWPYTITANTLALTSGAISWTQVQQGDWWRFWSTDPRVWANQPRNGGTAYVIGDTYDQTAIYPQTALTSVFAFWRPLRPKFTYVSFVAAQTYPVGSYVYDPIVILTGSTLTSTTINMASTAGVQAGQQITGPGIPANTVVSSVTPNTSILISNAATATATVSLTFGTGNVFLCITQSLGSAIMNTADWSPVTIPEPLVKPLLTYSEGLRVRSKGNDPAKYFADTEELLAQEKARALPINGASSPWDFSYSQ